MKKKTIVYIMHPISGDVETNLKALSMIYKWITDNYADIIPFIPYYATVCSLDDSKPIYRQKGMSHNEELILSGVVDQAWWFTDRISAGMQDEITLFKGLNIPTSRVYIDGYN